MIKLKLITILMIAGALFFTSTTKTNAQMMGNSQEQTSPSQSNIQEEQSMQDAGQLIFQQLQSGQTTCQALNDDDFEKLGDYFMAQNLGSTEKHVAMDNQMTQMMGEKGNTNMHIIFGKRASGCFPDTQLPANTPSFLNGMMNYNSSNIGGGGNNMMGFGYGMMNGSYGLGGNILSIAVHLVILVDLILLGVYLWKRIKK